MSVMIMYDSIFIRSPLGITPCIYAGDNRTYEPTISGRWRRDRSWFIFHNWIGIPEAELKTAALSYSSDTHWYTANGRNIDDNAYARWLNARCKEAAPIEAILKVNHMTSVLAYVSCWSHGSERSERELVTHISTSAQLDDWIVATRSTVDRYKTNGGSAYPIIEWYQDKVVKPSRKRDDEQVVIKRGKLYMTEHSTSGSSWSPVAQNALVLSAAEARQIQADGLPFPHTKMVSADVVTAPYNAVIQFAAGKYQGHYLKKATPHRLIITPSVLNAYRYKDARSAEQTKVRLARRFQCSMEVCILPASDPCA